MGTSTTSYHIPKFGTQLRSKNTLIMTQILEFAYTYDYSIMTQNLEPNLGLHTPIMTKKIFLHDPKFWSSRVYMTT